MMNFHLNALPEDCLRLILEKCSLMELLPLRLVCTRWRLVIEQLCRLRRSLCIFECQQDQMEFESMRYYFLENSSQEGRQRTCSNFAGGDNVLIIGAGGGGVLLRHLADLFPNLNTLLLLYSRACLPLTERSPPPSLHSLTIVSKRRSTEIAGKLWSWIDDIDSLRSLALFGMFDNRLPVRLQALSRLEVFSLTGYCDDLVPIVGQFGPKLRHLLLDRLSLPISRLETLFRERQCQWVSSVRHLSIGSINTGMVCAKGYVEKITQFMAFFCRHFTQLTSLQVRFALQIPLGKLVAELARLPLLTELRLAQIGSSNPKTEPDRRTLPCLTSVKRLFLESTTAKAAQDPFWKFWIPIIFPNLETWSLSPECSFNDKSGTRLNHVRVQ